MLTSELMVAAPAGSTRQLHQVLRVFIAAYSVKMKAHHDLTLPAQHNSAIQVPPSSMVLLESRPSAPGSEQCTVEFTVSLGGVGVGVGGLISFPLEEWLVVDKL